MEGYRDDPAEPVVFELTPEMAHEKLMNTIDYRQQSLVLGAECKRLKNLLSQIALILEEGQVD